MRDSRRAISLLIFEHRKHAVAGRIRGPQAQDALQKRNRVLASLPILDLDRALQRRNIVRRDIQRLGERRQRVFVVALMRVSHTLNRPQFRTVWFFLMSLPDLFQSLGIVPGLQQPADRRNALGGGLGASLKQRDRENKNYGDTPPANWFGWFHG